MPGLWSMPWLVVSQVFPAYSTHQAIKNRDQREALRWVKYWMCYSLLFCVDDLLGWLVSWLPLYNSLFFCVVLWMQIPAFGGASFLYDICAAQLFDAAHVVALQLVSAAFENARTWVRDMAIIAGEYFMRSVQERAMPNTNGLFVAVAFNNIISRLGIGIGIAPHTTHTSASAMSIADTTSRKSDTSRSKFALGAASKNSAFQYVSDSENETYNDGNGDHDPYANRRISVGLGDLQNGRDSAEWQVIHNIGSSSTSGTTGYDAVLSPTSTSVAGYQSADRSTYLDRLVSPVSSALRNAYTTIASRLSTQHETLSDSVTDVVEASVPVTATVSAMDFDTDVEILRVIEPPASATSVATPKRAAQRRRTRDVHLTHPDTQTTLTPAPAAFDPLPIGTDDRPLSSLRPRDITDLEARKERSVVEPPLTEANLNSQLVINALERKPRRIPKAPATKMAVRASRRSRAAQRLEEISDSDADPDAGHGRARSNSRSRIPRKMK